MEEYRSSLHSTTNRMLVGWFSFFRLYRLTNKKNLSFFSIYLLTLINMLYIGSQFKQGKRGNIFKWMVTFINIYIYI